MDQETKGELNQKLWDMRKTATEIEKVMGSVLCTPQTQAEILEQLDTIRTISLSLQKFIRGLK